MKKYSLAVHGGAGTLLKSETSEEKDKEYHFVLSQALSAGHEILRSGGPAVAAVEASVCELENSPLFNAGKGSVFTSDQEHELEAAMMCGNSLNAGSVAGLKRVKNPISLCKAILYDDDFVYLFGDGAEEYARTKDIEIVENKYFSTEFRRAQLYDAQLAGDSTVLDHDGNRKFGTVGAVALDHSGNLAAATSTGGLTNKRFGRVGDSSVIGAGCYANNDRCAISATGYGEFFLRNVTAHEIASIIKHGGRNLKSAADEVVMKQLKMLGGEGGIIGLDRQGNVVLCFNSEGMYRGWVTSDDHQKRTAIYKD